MHIPLASVVFATFFTSCALAVAIGHGGQREDEQHGARSPHEQFDDAHYKGGVHHDDIDHQAILGTKKMAEAFDKLPPAEARKRLRKMCEKMDVNNDLVISKDELSRWIEKNMKSLDLEEADERFEEMDVNNDSRVSWKEYRDESFGIDPDNELDLDDLQLLREDELYFKAADLNKDGYLDRTEFTAFQTPEHYPHMHDTLIDMTLSEKDKNKDGYIDFNEFISSDDEQSFKQPGTEWYTTEKSRFNDEYDLNHDGKLDRNEMKAWLAPNLIDTAADEATHLMKSTDKNGDGILTYDEVVDEHELWVGSEATNFGDRLTDEL